MNFELIASSLEKAATQKTDALVVLISDETQTQQLPQWLAQPLHLGDVETKAGSFLSAYRVEGLSASRLVIVGIGQARPKEIRTAVATALAALKGVSLKKLHVAWVNSPSEASLRALAVALHDATYQYQTTKPAATGRTLTQVTVSLQHKDVGKALMLGFTRALAICQGVEEAKEWGNRPANYATPSLLAQEAKRLAKLGGMSCEVLGPEEIEKLGMGSFAAVAQGSAEPAQFIELRYQGAAKNDAPVVLVGKGITFDTGGISIKPAAEMDEMKFDMCGAASVLGAFQAFSVLKPKVNVVGLIAACENMPSSTALKPGDVVTSMSGKSIEVLNTDAEGRLVLCDALTYAERFQPRAVVDIATLTGACMVALGGVRSGLFANDEALAAALEQAAQVAQDPVWRLPLDDEYAEGLRTNFADMANVAGRAGGAVTAAKFLQNFAGKFAWAHLDIAGTAWKGGPLKGATGRPVGVLVEYVLSLAESDASSVSKPKKRRAAPVKKVKADAPK